MATTSEIGDERAILIEQKLKLANDLQDVKQILTQTMSKSHFQMYDSKRVGITRKLQEIDGKIAMLNCKKSQASLKECAPKQTKDSFDTVRSLVELRNKYQQFSADGTRVASMRRMASEFILELNPIIRTLVNRKQDNEP